MARGPLKKSKHINTKQHVGFLLYQCDGCTCFRPISSAMFGSVLDNATLISWIASNRFRADDLMQSSAENADSDSCWFFWKVLRGPQKIVSRSPVWEPLVYRIWILKWNCQIELEFEKPKSIHFCHLMYSAVVVKRFSELEETWYLEELVASKEVEPCWNIAIVYWRRKSAAGCLKLCPFPRLSRLP